MKAVAPGFLDCEQQFTANGGLRQLQLLPGSDGDTADNNNMRMILDFTAAESRMAFSSD